MAFSNAVVEQARARGLLSNEHFTVDGTLIEAWEDTRVSSARRRLANPVQRSRQPQRRLSW
jgi:hypothetical protein